MGKGIKIHKGIKISIQRFTLHPIMFQKRFTAQKSRSSCEIRGGDEGGGFSPIQRLNVGVHIAHMQQRHIAAGVKRINIF
jgi:hypothetical protein